MGLNICVLGGGSAYTPGLIESMLRLRDRLPLDQLTLMDIDPAKLETVGRLTERLVAGSGAKTKVVYTTDRAEALQGADFVLCQIRVGGLPARALDEKVPLRHGVIGQETTGPGGFAMALRTIPVMLDVARDMERICPEAWLINYTNPTGIVAAALHWHTKVKVLSICDVPIGVQHLVAQVLGANRRDIFVDYAGLNHLGWFRHIYHRGGDVLPQLLMMAGTLKALPPGMQIEDDKTTQEFLGVLELFKRLKVVPSPYLQYYYQPDKMLKKQLEAESTRAEVVMALEMDLLAHYREVTDQAEPHLWKKRGGDWHADLMMEVVCAIANNLSETFVVNVPNRGAIAHLPDDAIVEIPAVVDARGAQALVVGEMPPEMLGLVQIVHAYERLTVQAAVEGSYEKALKALTIHPLVPSIDVAEALLNDLLDAHRQHLPQFARSGA